MAARYYFGHEAQEFGPFSAARMRELAAAGEILPTDAVWQEGTERRVAAADVKNLFSKLASAAAPAAGDKGTPNVGGTALADSVIVDTAENQAAPPPAEEAPKQRYVSEKKSQPQATFRKRRVTSIKGAVLINQDGVSLNFRKKCDVCGYEDLSKSSAKIPVGSTRVNFFCRECRKMRRVEIHGSI